MARRAGIITTMTKPDKRDLQHVADIVDIEGLGYAIQCYMSGDGIADPELAAKWDACQALMNEIEHILEPFSHDC